MGEVSQIFQFSLNQIWEFLESSMTLRERNRMIIRKESGILPEDWDSHQQELGSKNHPTHPKR